MTAATQGAPARQIRRDIEGLRAVAVLMVLAFHLGVPGAEGGFAGVDVFFVISGFLITGLLVRELESNGRIDLLTFYARRARRLLPAALLVIAVTFGAGWFLLPGSEQPRLAHDSLGATLYVVNWVLAARSVDYLAEDAAPSALQHYWSLSVEEQFYVVWPLVILLGVVLAARSRARSPLPVIATLLVVLTTASFVWGLLSTAQQPARAYFVTTTRLWELAVGALLVFALPALARQPGLLRGLLAIVGLGAILATVLLVGPATPWPGWAATVPVLGAAAVIAAGSAPRDTLAGRLLGLAPLVWLGGLSYAVYLWHWPLIVLARARFGDLDPAALAGLGVLAVLLAWGTKHVVEDPTRFNPWLSARAWRSLATSGAAMALVCGAVLGLLSSRPSLEESLTSDRPTVSAADPTDPAHAEQTGAGTTEPPPTTVSSGPGTLVADVSAVPWVLRPDPAAAYTRQGPISPEPDVAPWDVPRYYADECQIPSGQSQPRDDCVYGDPEGGSDVVLLGDSKTGQWFSAVDEIARQEGWRLQLHLKSACPFTVQGAEEDCDAFGRAVLDLLRDRPTPPDLALVSTGAAATPELLDGMTQALRSLEEQGTTVVMLRDNPYPPGSQYPCAAEHLDDLRECVFEPTEAGGNDLLTSVADRLDLSVVDLDRWICPEETACPVAIGERLIWRQGSHVTDTYARNLTPFLYRELSRLGVADRPVGEIAIDDVPERRSSES